MFEFMLPTNSVWSVFDRAPDPGLTGEPFAVILRPGNAARAIAAVRHPWPHALYMAGDWFREDPQASSNQTDRRLARTLTRDLLGKNPTIYRFVARVSSDGNPRVAASTWEAVDAGGTIIGTIHTQFEPRSIALDTYEDEFGYDEAYVPGGLATAVPDHFHVRRAQNSSSPRTLGTKRQVVRRASFRD